jgi:uncharacterized membrane protein YfcA
MTVVLEIVIGLVVGLVVGALGGGGGVLTVPALVYLLGASTHEAATASLIIVGVAALAGLPAHAWRGNVRWGAGAVFGLAGTAAALAGAVAARHLDPSVLLLAFAGIITVAAALMIRDARRGPAGEDGPSQEPPSRTPGEGADVTEHPSAPWTSPSPTSGGGVLVAVPRTSNHATSAGRSRTVRALTVLLGGMAVGLMTGLFGVGGGFLAVPVLVLVMRWPTRAAIGTSLLVIVINAVAALVPRLGSEVLDARLLIPVTVAAVVGTLLGKLASDRVSAPSLSRIFAVLLLLLAAYTALRSGLALAG